MSTDWTLDPIPTSRLLTVGAPDAAPLPGWMDPRLPDALEAHAARLRSPESTVAYHVRGMAERLRTVGTVAAFADDVEAYQTAALDLGLASDPDHRVLIEGLGKALADLARGRSGVGRWLVLAIGSTARAERHAAGVARIVAAAGSRR